MGRGIRYNNKLRGCALISLFITSYIPLFVIIILKQVQTNWEYLCFGGLNGDAIMCMMEKFGMPIVLFIIMLFGTIGLYLLIKNLEKNLPNGLDIRVLVISLSLKIT